MRLLLDDGLAPITSKIGFIESDLQAVVDAFLGWQSPIQNKRGVSFITNIVNGNLEDALLKLEPLSSVESRKYLFIPTASSWTAIFDNSNRGIDEGPIAYLSKLMKKRSIRIVTIPHTLTGNDNFSKGRYGATILSIFGPEAESQSNRIRTIYALNDGGNWEFKAVGLKQFFEDENNYSVPKIWDRFTPKILEQYLLALSINAFDERFYLTRDGATLLSKEGPSASNLREYSLKETREHFI